MEKRQSTERSATHGWIAKAPPRPPVPRRAVGEDGIMIRLFWD